MYSRAAQNKIVFRQQHLMANFVFAHSTCFLYFHKQHYLHYQILFLRAALVFCIFTNSTNYITVTHTTLILLHLTAAPKKLLNHMAKTAKEKPAANTGTKTKRAPAERLLAGRVP